MDKNWNDGAYPLYLDQNILAFPINNLIRNSQITTQAQKLMVTYKF